MLKKSTKQIWVGLVLASALNISAAASFDCTKASTRVEKMICADISLSRLDDKMAMAYRTTALPPIGDPSAAAWLKKTQREWLKQRNACETSTCLRDVYATRIDDLCSMPAIVGTRTTDCSSED